MANGRFRLLFVSGLLAVLIAAGGAMGLYWAYDAATTPMERYYATGQWAMTLNAALRDLSADPNDQVALLYAARASHKSERWADAVEFFRRVSEPISDDDLWNQSECLARLSRWTEALELMSQLYERKTDVPRVLRQMAVYATEAGQEESAIKLAERLATYPAHAAAAFGIIGSIHQREQRYADAAEFLGKALEHDPDGRSLPLSPGELNTAMAWNLLELGEVEKAEQRLVKAVELRPDDGMAPWLLGKARLALNDRSGAYAWWIESLRRHSHNPDALLSLGMLAIEQSEFESAVDWLTLAVESAPEYSYPKQVLGSAYVRLGRVARGKELMAEAERLREVAADQQEEDRLVRVAPESPVGLIARSNQALRLGRTDEARALLEHAVRRYDDARAKEALAQFDLPGGPVPVVIRTASSKRMADDKTETTGNVPPAHVPVESERSKP